MPKIVSLYMTQIFHPQRRMNPSLPLYPATEEEQFRFIRTTYLPEIILAYHSALYTCGHYVSREILVQCLSLATIVSASPTLTESFIASQRMCELVDSFAISSREVASVRDPQALKKKLPHGASLDVWRVKGLEQEEDVI